MIKTKIKITPTDLLILGIFLSGFGWLFYNISIQAQYNWNWKVIPQYILRFDALSQKWVPGMILSGIFVTLRISAWATLFALIIGMITGLLRTGRNRFLRIIGTGYVELIRNIPVLVWIFIFYYFIGDRIVPLLGIDQLMAMENEQVRSAMGFFVAAPSQLSVFVSGAAALAIYEGAYIAEIIRAGIQSVEKGQWEASSGLGFTRLQQMRHIIFPQALRRVLPPLAGQFISTIKDSAIVSVISIQELTFQGMELMAATFLTFEVWITIMVVYLVICFCCSLAIEQFELKLSKRSQGTASALFPGT